LVNFVIVVDPDVKRRSLFIEAIEPILPPVDGLVTCTCSKEDFCAIWAAVPSAPVSYVVDNKGVAVIWGEAIRGPGSERIDATQLRYLWDNPADSLPEEFDGFFAAVVYKPKLGLIVGADILGIFPIYYYATDDVILVGSSPELFRYHPSFRMKFNPAGLVGILLTNSLFDGQTLLHGVKRLSAGHLLVWYPGGSPKEVRQYEIPLSTKYFDLSFSAQLDILDKALDKAIARHVTPSNRYGLLLSGGLDSRMLGGYLKQKGIDAVALTDGLRTDLNMKCAIAVASTLGFQHSLVNIGFDEYPFYANLKAKWGHLANGFNGIMFSGFYLHLRKLASRIVTGLLCDSIVGGSHISWACSASDATMSVESFLTRINSYGFRPNILKKLLRHEIFDDLVSDTLARIRKVYQNYSKLEFQRAWCFDLYHRQRFYIGSNAWLLSFGAWPVSPVVDRQLLEVIGGMPVTTLMNRRVQEELLCKRFPELAKLPLDRNSYNTAPLRPTLLQRFHADFMQLLYGAARARHVVRALIGERHYYSRMFDFNGLGWRAIRQQAEPYRDRLLHLFNKDVFEELLPTPDVTIRFGNRIVEASGLKLLLGFLLWSRDHL
jgi:asparagine synthase (glutamine-hydrolysing)